MTITLAFVQNTSKSTEIIENHSEFSGCVNSYNNKFESKSFLINHEITYDTIIKSHQHPPLHHFSKIKGKCPCHLMPMLSGVPDKSSKIIQDKLTCNNYISLVQRKTSAKKF